MSDSCSVCGISPADRPALVLITNTVRGKRRTVEWTECAACFMRLEREMEEAKRERERRAKEEQENAA